MPKVAHIWFGSFEDEKAYKAYANHSRKKCQFLEDFGVGSIGATFFDSFRAEGESLRKALVRLLYSAGYLDAVTEKLEKLKVADDVNAVKLVLLNKRHIKEIDSSNWSQVEGPLQFLGAFEFGDKVPLTHPEDNGEPQYSQAGFVSVWIGSVKGGAEAADAYMEEDYDQDDESPLSQFGRDWKLCYDHDYLFHESSDEPRPVAKLLDGWEGARKFGKPAAKAAKEAGITEGNCVVVAYDLDYTVKPPFSTSDPAGYWRQKGKPKAKSPLKFVGAFRVDG